MNNEMYVYKPGSTHAETILRDGVCIYTGQTLAAITEKYPTVLILTREEFEAASDAVLESMIEQPKPITQERYYEMMDCLPLYDGQAGTELSFSS
jgi:hypothetical protein